LKVIFTILCVEFGLLWLKSILPSLIKIVKSTMLVFTFWRDGMGETENIYLQALFCMILLLLLSNQMHSVAVSLNIHLKLSIIHI